MIKKMRRSKCISIYVGFTLMFLIFFSLNDVIAAEKVYNLTFQSAWAAGYALNTPHQKHMDLIEAYSNGRIKITRHTGGEVLPSYQTWTGTGKGVVDGGFACNCYTLRRSHASAFFCSTPGSDNGMIERTSFILNGGGLELLQELLGGTYNVKVFPGAALPTEVFLYSNKRIDTIEDLKKLKVRSAGIRGDVFKEAGCTVINLSPGDVVPGMEKGVIDACELVNIDNDFSLGMGDVSKYVYYAPSPVAGHLFFFMNLDVWNRLPKDIQEIVEKASKDACYWSIGQGLISEFEAITKATKTSKVKIMKLPKEVDNHINMSSDRLYKKLKEKDPDIKRVMEAMDKFNEENKDALIFSNFLI